MANKLWFVTIYESITYVVAAEDEERAADLVFEEVRGHTHEGMHIASSDTSAHVVEPVHELEVAGVEAIAYQEGMYDGEDSD